MHTTSSEHFLDEELEAYYLGGRFPVPNSMTIEEHLLWCGVCLDRMKEIERYIDEILGGIVSGSFDQELKYQRRRKRHMVCGGPQG